MLLTSSEAFHIHNVLKQRDELSPLIFNYTLEYIARKYKIWWGDFIWIEYINPCSMLMMLIYWAKTWNTERLLNASTDVGIEVNGKKMKCIVISCHQNAGRYHDLFLAYVS